MLCGAGCMRQNDRLHVMEFLSLFKDWRTVHFYILRLVNRHNMLRWCCRRISGCWLFPLGSFLLFSDSDTVCFFSLLHLRKNLAPFVWLSWAYGEHEHIANLGRSCYELKRLFLPSFLESGTRSNTLRQTPYFFNFR